MRKILYIYILACIVCFNSGYTFQSPLKSSQTESVAATYIQIISDNLDNQKINPQDVFITDSGTYIEADLTDDLLKQFKNDYGVDLKPGDRVQLSGSIKQKLANKFLQSINMEAIKLDAVKINLLEPFPEGQIRGPQKTLFLLLNFLDFRHNTSLENAQSEMEEVDRYYVENSQGLIHFEGVLCKEENPDCKVDILEVNINANQPTSLFWQAILMAQIIYTADSYIDFSKYNRLILRSDFKAMDEIGALGMGTRGPWRIPTSDGIVELTVAWIDTHNDYRFDTVIAEQLAHNFNLGNAHSTMYGAFPETDPENTIIREYGDVFSVMGISDNLYADNFGFHNAIHRELLGWIKPGNIHTISTNDHLKEFTIHPLEFNMDDLQNLKIPRKLNFLPDNFLNDYEKDENKDYVYLEFRLPVSFDQDMDFYEQGNYGALIHIKDKRLFQFNETLLIDADPATPASRFNLLLGEWLTDPLSGISFGVTKRCIHQLFPELSYINIGISFNEERIPTSETDEGCFVYEHDELSSTEVSLSSPSLKSLVGEEPKAQFGKDLSPAGDVNGDGKQDFLVGSIDQSFESDWKGKVYLYFGHDHFFDDPSHYISFIGDTFDQAYQVSSAGNVNGDEYDDFLILGHDIGSYGGVALILGRSDQDWQSLVSTYGTPLPLSTVADKIFAEEVSNTEILDIAGVGDVNGDQYDDFMIGEIDAKYKGKNYLVLGRENNLWGQSPQVIGLSAVNITFVDEKDYNSAYEVGYVGDFNADGIDDILIGGEGDSDTGKIYVIWGTQSWNLQTNVTYQLATDADMAFVDESYGFLASKFAGVGDVNGDEIIDIVIGAEWADSSQTNDGRVYLVYGRKTWDRQGIEIENANYLIYRLQDIADHGFMGRFESDNFGQYVYAAGNFNGDAYGDFLIASDGQNSEGNIHLVLGNPGNDSWESYVLKAEQLGDSVRKAVFVGDLDGNGLDEILIGAPGNDEGGSSTGKIYLISYPDLIGSIQPPPSNEN